MKKLSLSNLKMGSNEVLHREQLKTVVGGYDGFYCAGVYDACSVYISYPDFSACMTRWNC